MNEVILKSTSDKPIKELVIAALEAEKKELLTALLRTKEYLSKFENKYRLTTSKFISTPAHSLKIDNMEAIEWTGEYETLQRIEDRLKILGEIEVCT